MNPLPSSSSAERALHFPDVSSWTDAAPQTQNLHRWAFIALTGLLTLLAATFEWSLLAAESWTWINLFLFGLFILLFAHVAIGFSQAFFGFLILSDRRNATVDDSELIDDVSTLPETAVVVPIYNEAVTEVFARLRVMHDSLKSLGALDRFQFFVLSDSTDKEKAEEEELAWARLVAVCGAAERIFYRRRKLPLNRKSGNIADFCRRWGGQYRYMICLDADSLMSARTLVRLVRRMEDNHRIGILQTVPQAINGKTIWSRLQQFAMALYGPIFAAGANFWQQQESNFWGHNAIIRLAPFIQHCALPELPTRSSIGTRPMSHDFVEAALMRRAGWEVRLAEDLDGSYEETPPTVVEHLKRDRRWCQGNLQHWSLALARGFKPITRFHFLHGIFSFLASPLLLCVLGLGFLKNLGGHGFSEGLFVDMARAKIAFLLFAFTMLLLLLPKFLALGLTLRRGSARDFGGAGKMIASAILEMIVSILIAPVFLFFHAKFVFFNLLGKRVEWHAQQRGCGEGTVWREARQVFFVTTILGLAVSFLTAWLTPGYLPWLLPIVVGWLLAVPLAALVSDPQIGLGAQLLGCFAVPSEIAAEKEVLALRRAFRDRDGFTTTDPLAAAILHPALHGRLPNLTPNEQNERHRQIWMTPSAELSPLWRQALASFEVSTASSTSIN